MAKASFNRSSFAGGVWSARAQGRLDDPRYGTAMNVCLNALLTEEGAWIRRPCWQMMGTSRKGAPGQTIEIPYRFGAKAVLEFTYSGADGGKMRMWVPPYTSGDVNQRLGDDPYVLQYDEADSVAAFDTTAPATVTTDNAQTWVTGDEVQLFNATGGTIACRQFTVVKVDTTHFELYDAVTGFGIDGTLPEFGVGVAYISHIQTFDTLYTSLTQIREVNVVATDGLYFTLHDAVATYVLQLAFTGVVPTFTYVDAAFQNQDGPYLDPLRGTSQTDNSPASAVFVSGSDWTLTTTAYWTADDVVRGIRLWNQPPAYVDGTTYAKDDKVTFNGNFWKLGKASVPAGTQPGQSYASGGVQYLPWVLDPTAGYWVFGAVIGYTSSTVVTVRLSGSPILNQSTIDTWLPGLYCTRVGWPNRGCWHGGRLWLAGALPNRIDSTISGVSGRTFSVGDLAQINPQWFAPTDKHGVVLDSSGISEMLNAPGENAVQWMVDDDAGLILGTTSGEFTIRPAPSDDVITPTSIKSRRQSQYGCANIRAVQTGGTVVFVQGNYRHVWEFMTDALSSKLSGRMLNEEALHLHADFLYKLAYMEDPIPVVWALDLSGNLTSCTYRRVSRWATEPPKIYAWATHTNGGDRQFESICGATRGGDALFYNTVAGLTTSSITDTSATRHFVVLTQPNDPGQDVPTNAFFCDEMMASSGVFGSDTGVPAGGGPGPDGGTGDAGKFYQEFDIVSISSGGSGGAPMAVGVAGYNETRATGFTLPRTATPGVGAQECVVFAHNGDVWISNTHISTGAASYVVGDRVAIRVDTPNRTIAFRNVTTASAWSSDYTTSGINTTAGLFVFFCGTGVSGTDKVTLIAPGSETGTIPTGFVAWGTIQWSSAVQAYTYLTASLRATFASDHSWAAIGPGVTTGAPTNTPSPYDATEIGSNYFVNGIPRVGSYPNDSEWQCGFIGVLATGGKASP